MTRIDKVRIFVSSPGDVQDERNQLDDVVRELNDTLSALVPERRLLIELWRWEKDGHPGYGGGPQGVLNRQFDFADFDVFVGILWRRFGTPTARAGSGTEEEYRMARRSWAATGQPREILFYFCQAPAEPPKEVEDARQQVKVTELRASLKQDALVWDYADHHGFADQVRPHLVQVISRVLDSDPLSTGSPQRDLRRRAGTDIDATRRRVATLADEYVQIRAAEKSGPERTGRMEVIVSKMRSIALSADLLVDELADSDSPGLRLCLVAILQALPRAEMLPWLGARFAVEAPFVAYHAAIALLSAARSLDLRDLDQVLDAVAAVRPATAPAGSDRAVTLESARQAVLRRQAAVRAQPIRPTPPNR